MTDSNDVMREFEAWLPTQGYLIAKRQDGKYESSHTEIMWGAWREAWYAAAKHYSTPAPVDEAGHKQTFCPECGCEEYKYASWNKEHECKNCGQSWFADVDYSRAIRGNLTEFKELQKQAAVTPYLHPAADANEYVKTLLEEARKKVAPIVAQEREAEKIPQGLMEFRMGAAEVDKGDGE